MFIHAVVASELARDTIFPWEIFRKDMTSWINCQAAKTEFHKNTNMLHSHIFKKKISQSCLELSTIEPLFNFCTHSLMNVVRISFFMDAL